MKNELRVKKKIDLKKKIKSLKDATLKIGFPNESAKTHSTKDGATAVHKAVVNNFGLGVPRRPFMNIAFAKNKAAYRKIIANGFKKIETLNVEKLVNKLGVKGQGDVQRAIVELRTPANSEQTIKTKGSSNPLIDTGHMRQSVTFHAEAKNA